MRDNGAGARTGLTPEQLVSTARAYALAPFHGAVSVEPAFIAGLATLAARGLNHPTDSNGVPA